MNETDAFFTHSIVGAPRSLILGRRMHPAQLAREGIEIPRSANPPRLTRAWQDWMVLRHDDDRPGMPRPRPGKFRRFMERHALIVLLLGLALNIVGIALILASRWEGRL